MTKLIVVYRNFRSHRRTSRG